uniref:Uncharacterized protein n=1 Tax=Leersia perrieri TaxID=77586 RepID=A0A0D9WRK1_9ORYZ
MKRSERMKFPTGEHAFAGKRRAVIHRPCTQIDPDVTLLPSPDRSQTPGESRRLRIRRRRGRRVGVRPRLLAEIKQSSATRSSTREYGTEESAVVWNGAGDESRCLRTAAPARDARNCEEETAELTKDSRRRPAVEGNESPARRTVTGTWAERERRREGRSGDGAASWRRTAAGRVGKVSLPAEGSRVAAAARKESRPTKGVVAAVAKGVRKETRSGRRRRRMGGGRAMAAGRRRAAGRNGGGVQLRSLEN